MVKVLTNNVLSGFGRKQQQGNKIGGDIYVSTQRRPLSCCFYSLVNFINQIINYFSHCKLTMVVEILFFVRGNAEEEKDCSEQRVRSQNKINNLVLQNKTNFLLFYLKYYYR